MFVIDFLFSPIAVSFLLFGLGILYLFIVLIPFFRKKIGKRYLYGINLILLFITFLFAIIYLMPLIGKSQYLPDDPTTEYIYQGSARGFVTFYTYERFTEACTGCNQIEVHIVPFLFNILIIILPLYLISLIQPIQDWAKKTLNHLNSKWTPIVLSLILIYLGIYIFFEELLIRRVFVLF